MSIQQLTTPRRIGRRSNGMLMTPEEFDALAKDPDSDWDEDYRYELIHGVLIVVPAPGIGERSPNDELGRLVRNFQVDHPNGSSVDGTAPEQTVRIGRNRRRCDRAIWCGLGRRPNTRRDVPTIMVEFVGPDARNRKRDYIEKPREYKAAGVREYWIIDRFKRTMTVHRAGRRQVVVAEDGVYRTDLMPGFELPLAALLEQLDGFEDSEETDE